MCARESEVKSEMCESDVCDPSPRLCQRPGFVCFVSGAAFVHLWWGCSLSNAHGCTGTAICVSESMIDVTSILVPFAEILSGAWN